MASLDVVLFGPTGVTGREVARHLARRAPEVGLRWGVAGRDRDRIEQVLDGLPGRPDEILLADAADPDSIEAMVTSTAVVANLVGPYARFGAPVYRACAEHGVAEIDLTGEIDWVRTMIDELDDLATETGARIVPTAGFEALPFDLGALHAAHELHERTGDPVVSVDIALSIHSTGSISALSDAVSGGTFVSGVEALRRGQKALAADPHLLDTPSSTARSRYDLRPRKHPATKQWLAPVFPSPYLNPPVVHRSASLLRDSDDPIFDPSFAYREGAATDSTVPKPAAGAAAVSLSVMTAGLGLLGRAPDAVRERAAKWMLAAGPKSGDGPRPEDLDSWSYRLDVRATDARGGHLDVVVEGDGHPGYKSTATMVGEAALALADPGSGVPDGAGFLTPATALGLGVLDRMGEAGLRFRVG
jgi:short subunit dehydrogenase-like uncharacterized protein